MNLSSEELISILQSPTTGLGCNRINKDVIEFGTEQLPIINNVPILIDEKHSLFSVEALRENVATTQSSAYNDKTNWKNRLRMDVLPQITKDYHYEKRYKALAETMAGKTVLIIGTGNKPAYYKKIFNSSKLILTDVHLQFEVDLVVDAHQLPFKNESIDLVIAGQVMEHTMRPWVVASEMERVIKSNGLIHIESPMCFGFHAIPYDFYRFTFMGLRSLFPNCLLQKAFITEGAGNTFAMVSSGALVSRFSGRNARRLATLFSRFAFGWIKTFDKYADIESHNLNKWSLPMGIGMTFISDKRYRTDRELMQDFYDYFKQKS